MLQAWMVTSQYVLKDFITEYGLNPSEVKESSGLTPLHLACKHGHLNVVHYLIKEQNCNPVSVYHP